MAVDGTLIIREAIAKGAEFLQAKGITTARLDAELLIGRVVGLDRLGLYLNFDRPLNTAERAEARELLRRRGLREPVAYILGTKEFRSREFVVDRRVLIPRPETELLVEHAEEELARRFPDAGGAYRILELGAGSGAIAVSLAADLPGSTLVVTEISPEAAEVCRLNAERHGVLSRVDIRLQSDLAHIAGPFHGIVSNPPYVDEADRDSLAADVRQYEPHQALFAPEKGLAMYNLLTSAAPSLLLENGFLMVEFGMGQADIIREIAVRNAMRVSQVWKDYAEIDRVALILPEG